MSEKSDIIVLEKKTENMLKNLITKEIFANRKEAKQKMGHAVYNKAVKNKEIVVLPYK